VAISGTLIGPDIIGPGSAKNMLRPVHVATGFGVDGEPNLSFQDLALVALGFRFRDLHPDQTAADATHASADGAPLIAAMKRPTLGMVNAPIPGIYPQVPPVPTPAIAACAAEAGKEWDLRRRGISSSGLSLFHW